VVLLEVTSPGLRPDYDDYAKWSNKSSDLLIIVMKTGGQIQRGYNINMNKADIGMKIGDGAFFILNSKYIFGGQSWGYYTRYQNETYDIAAPYTDSYLFNYNPEANVECFYRSELSRSMLT